MPHELPTRCVCRCHCFLRTYQVASAASAAGGTPSEEQQQQHLSQVRIALPARYRLTRPPATPHVLLLCSHPAWALATGTVGAGQNGQTLGPGRACLAGRPPGCHPVQLGGCLRPVLGHLSLGPGQAGTHADSLLADSLPPRSHCQGCTIHPSGGAPVLALAPVSHSWCYSPGGSSHDLPVRRGCAAYWQACCMRSARCRLPQWQC